MIPGGMSPLMQGVAVGAATDADATAFLSAAGISDTITVNAIHAMVIGLKADGLWSLCSGLYPFVGSTASTHKWNLKDPRDLDAAGRIGFNGSNATHASGGATVNTDVNLFRSIDTSSAPSGSISAYVRTELAGTWDMASSSAQTQIYSRYIADNKFYPRVSRDGPGDTGFSVGGSSLGMFISNRVSANDTRSRGRGTLCVNSATTYTAYTSDTIYLRNGGRQIAWAHVGLGMTDAQTLALHNHITTYQTAMGRNV